MFVPISNVARDYDWGSPTLIPELLGIAPTGAPQAELWLGDHPASPSRLVAGDHPDQTLDQWVAAAPERALGTPASPAHLPFLFKVLAAAAPLSLQAHPTTAQAEAGFARENQAGIPLDAPERNYRDQRSKPEMIVAASERFEALCAFRDLEATREVLTTLADAAEHHGVMAHRVTALRDRLVDAAGLAGAVEAILTRADPDLVDETLAACDAALAIMGGADEPADAREDEPRAAIETVRDAADRHPHDPGLVLALLLNRVSLRRGEALWLPAGNIHAYLDGLGIELMGASDNVLRGGLTSKHVDVPELMATLNFSAGPPPLVVPVEPEPGVRVYRPDGAEFEIVHVLAVPDATHPVALRGPAIALVTRGTATLIGAHGRLEAMRGESAFITPDEDALRIKGDGEIFLATVRSAP